MSRPVSATIPHSLGRAEARNRIEKGFGSMRSQLTGGFGSVALSFNERWEGDRLYFEGSGLGQQVTGRLDVLDDSVVIEVQLPDLLAALAETIMGKVKKQGQLLLEKK